MNTMQLGDYRGGRDTITNLMGAQIPQLQNVTDAAKNFAAIGLQSMGTRHALANKYNFELRNLMMGRDREMADRLMLAKQAGEQSAIDENDMIEGQVGAMTDWANLVINKYEPNSPEYNAAAEALAMIKKTGSGKGSRKYKASYLSYLREHGIDKPINVASLGSLAFKPEQAAPKPVAAADKKPTPAPVAPNDPWARVSRFSSRP
jgi:hypothetical protein